MKPQTLVLGIDDVPFDKFKVKHSKIIGTVMRASNMVEGILTSTIEVDGDDATVKIIDMVNNCKFKTKLKAIFLDGIAVAGFNVININSIYKHTSIPVIIVMRSFPKYDKIESALKIINQEKKITIINNTPKPVKINHIHIQFAGITESEAKEILELATKHAYIPECIRISHLIGQGLVFGESKGSP